METQNTGPFDRRVHIRNPKTGRIEKVQPYREYMTKDRQSVLERDGQFFWENGSPCPPEVVNAVLGARAPAHVVAQVTQVKESVQIKKAQEFEAEKQAALQAHISQRMAEQGYDKVQETTGKEKKTYFGS